MQGRGRESEREEQDAEHEHEHERWLTPVRSNMVIALVLLGAIALTLIVLVLTADGAEPAAFWALIGVISGKIGDIALELLKSDQK